MKKKYFAIGAGIGFVAALVVSPWLKALATILVGVAVGGVAVIVLIARAQGRSPQEVAAEVRQEVMNPKSKIEGLQDILIQITQKMRMTENADPRVAAKLDEIVDKFLEVIPEINHQYPDGDLTFTINRMVSDYLPLKFVNPYVNLPVDQRSSEERVQAALVSTNGMMEELEDIMQMVRNHRTNDFEAKNRFLAARFQ